MHGVNCTGSSSQVTKVRGYTVSLTNLPPPPLFSGDATQKPSSSVKNSQRQTTRNDTARKQHLPTSKRAVFSRGGVTLNRREGQKMKEKKTTTTRKRYTTSHGVTLDDFLRKPKFFSAQHFPTLLLHCAINAACFLNALIANDHAHQKKKVFVRINTDRGYYWNNEDVYYF